MQTCIVDAADEYSCRENAKEHLESVKATEAERQHMLTILRRVQQDEGQELATEQGTDAESDHEDNSDLGISDDLLKKLSVAVRRTGFQEHHAWSRELMSASSSFAGAVPMPLLLFFQHAQTCFLCLFGFGTNIS